MKNILISGGAGFIGSNFIPYFLNKYSDYNIFNIDKLTYAGDLKNLEEVSKSPRYKFINGDIRDSNQVNLIFDKYEIQGVIHFAAESHVDNSIENPSIFVETNVNGTFNLLDAAYKKWMFGPQKYNPNFEKSTFHHISTDEVYGSLGNEGYFSEKTPYAPNSPYSASKASSDMLVRSYFHTYGMNTVISNCSNNYGPKQNSEKLIPKIITNALSDKPIPVYGNGLNVRDWLYVIDHCKAIDCVYHNGVYGDTYCVGGKTEKTNIEIVEKICSILKNKFNKDFNNLITFVDDRAGHDLRYAVDISKINSELKWKPEESFESGLEKTIDWYLKNAR